jgi:hypothetical protein
LRGSRLSPLQLRIVQLLASVTPPWTLTGGAALAGFHLGHRTTRDLDLRWPGMHDLQLVTRGIVERLSAAGLDCDVLQSSSTFERLRVADGSETVLVDLVADPVASIEPPLALVLGGARVNVDTLHEILVNKLCALLGRMELRDLHDVRELLDHGGDLERALRDAPRKDGGFSPLTLAWVLGGMPAGLLAIAAGWTPAEADAMDAFRQALVDRLAAAGAPR